MIPKPVDPSLAPRASAYRRAAARRAKLIKRARVDPAAFIEYALPHEKTGKRVVNAPFHVEWQDFLTLNPWAVIIAPVEHAKTQQIAVGRVLWELGKNRNLRIALVSNTSGMAEKLLSAIKQHIERNPRVREVFPELVPSTRKGAPWHLSAIEVERTSLAKEPSILAVGVGGALVGSRTDLMVLDDVLDFENTRTVEQMKKTIDWFDSTAFTRLQDDEASSEYARCWFIGTPWHPEDILHVVGAREGWAKRRYSAVRNPAASPHDWIPIWPEQWSVARLKRRFAGMTPMNFARKYLCVVRLDSASRFKQEWLDTATAAGKGRRPLHTQPVLPNGRRWSCFTGVDLGIGQDEEHDETALFTIALDERQRRHVIQIEAGRWTGPEIVSRIRETHWRYNSIVSVESVAAQKFILQFVLQDEALPVQPFNTTASAKASEAFGIESIAVEMRAGLWVIPSGDTGQDIDDQIRKWMLEMLYYSPEMHTGDRLMACWFAREASRSMGGPRARRSLHGQR